MEENKRTDSGYTGEYLSLIHILWAESVEGVGTSIIFTLKKAKNTDLS